MPNTTATKLDKESGFIITEIPNAPKTRPVKRLSFESIGARKYFIIFIIPNNAAIQPINVHIILIAIE